MDTKGRLIAVFNLMQRIETKGDSTLFLADCMREMANIINSMPDEQAKNEKDDNVEGGGNGRDEKC